MAKRFWRPGAVLGALVGLALLASACGNMWDMDDHHRRMHGVGERGPQTPVVSNAAEATVEMRDYDLFPRDLTVSVGSEVMWVNRDSVPHDATDEDGGWSTSILNQGESATLTFDAPGVYQYLCTIHPDMKGTLTVA